MTAADLRPFPWRHTHGATMTDSESSDVAVVVYREDEAWDVDLLPRALTEDLAGLIQVLRQQPSIGGTVGLAAVGDEEIIADRGQPDRATDARLLAEDLDQPGEVLGERARQQIHIPGFVFPVHDDGDIAALRICHRRSMGVPPRKWSQIGRRHVAQSWLRRGPAVTGEYLTDGPFITF